jgi:hypothetical protein
LGVAVGWNPVEFEELGETPSVNGSLSARSMNGCVSTFSFYVAPADHSYG